MTTILIAIDPAAIPPQQVDRIRSIAPGAHLLITEQREEMQPVLGEIEIAAGHFPNQWISQAPRLRWFQQWGAGTDWLLKAPEIASRDFILTNASGVHAIPISEHILALMLAFARRLPQAFKQQEQHDWQGKAFWERKDQSAVFELSGKTMLLVGVGAIGERTARVAAALGMRVLGVRHDKEKTVPGIERMMGQDELAAALPEADFLVLTAPLTQETRQMIDAQAFARMKPSAYLINIGRGGTVDETALIQALQDGQIAGAGLDVFASEPLPPDSPLWDMPNVIITAHYAGDTPYYDERALEIFIDNLERYVHHRPMLNVVDKQRGY